MIARRSTSLGLALALAASFGACGDGGSSPGGAGGGAGSGGRPAAAESPPPVAADPRAEEARRSKDPAFAGPILFGEARRASTSGDSDLVLGLLAPSVAARAREGVRRQLDALRADPRGAAVLREQLGLSKSPADMTVDEYLRESAKTVAAMRMADREFGLRFASASLEKGPQGEGEVLVLVGEIPGADGKAASVVRSVFLWEDGRWGYDPELSRARNLARAAGTAPGR